MAVQAKTFTFTGFTGEFLDSRYPSGSVVEIVPTGLWSDPLETVDYYVATDGSDSNPGTSAGAAFLTIKKAMQTIAGQTGKTIQVQNGTYTGTDNLISDYFHSVNVSGTSGARNRIQAETVGGVIITDTGISSKTFAMSAIRITVSSYVDVTGFVIEFIGAGTNGHLPSTLTVIGGTAGYNRMARCLVRKTGNLEPFASWIRLEGSYNLVEDCYAVGGARYGFACGGTSSTDNRLVWRRCVGRFDYSQSNQPKACFNHYGANGGGTTGYVAYLNCLSLDQGAGNWGTGSAGFTYGGFTIIKTADNDLMQGCIAVNNVTEYGTWLDGSAHYLYDNIFWDFTWNPLAEANTVPSGLWVRSSLISVSDVQRLTIGEMPDLDIDNNAGSKFSTSHNILSPVGQNYLLYPNAGPYTADGATVLNRIGTSGTFYGDVGWNTVTDEPLWPWIDEDLIKTYFSKTIDIPSNGANGQTFIDTKRGFCAAGTQLDGATPITLTSYIWEYLGNQMPTSIYA